MQERIKTRDEKQGHKRRCPELNQRGKMTKIIIETEDMDYKEAKELVMEIHKKCGEKIKGYKFPKLIDDSDFKELEDK